MLFCTVSIKIFLVLSKLSVVFVEMDPGPVPLRLRLYNSNESRRAVPQKFQYGRDPTITLTYRLAKEFSLSKGLVDSDSKSSLFFTFIIC